MTIKDIARNCGVSVSTVSRVLNHHPDVSEEVRQRVLEEVRRSAYVPNTSARDLVRSSSDAIGVVVRGNGNLFFSAVLKTISSEIDRYGYTMTLRYIDSDADEVGAGALLEREKKLLGLIFLGGRFDYTPEELSVINIPYVCCSYTNYFGSLEDSACSSVSVDDFEVAKHAVEELIRRGHRRIAALIPSRDDHSISELRFNGYLAALEENGIPFDPWLLEETGSYEMRDNYEGTRKLLERTKDFSGLFTLSDTIGMAAMKALEDTGIQIPEDVSVIAIDGLSVSEYAIPTLTTMVQPVEEMGKESVRILVNMIKDRSYIRHKLLKAALREGASLRNI